VSEERRSLVIPTLATLVIHAGFAAGLHAAERFIGKPKPPAPMEVSFDVKTEPPPPPPPPPEAEAKPPEPPPQAPPPTRTPPPKKVASVTKPPPKAAPPDSAPPAPGPPDEAPAPQRVYTLGDGNIYVNPGSPTGTATGVPGGTGKGTGGGGAPGTTGTGGPRPVALASVKSMPEAIGDYDYDKDYPDEARKLGVEGEVLVRLLVDESGKVAEAKLARGLGHGLDQKALAFVRGIRFKPARDDTDRAVATRITWTVKFQLPR
jgi:protein TonB